ncbi:MULTISPECIES: sensor histidine kinase [Clostridia]|uniref:sensor histidine kinase n=1 Tax=Clostridia TaxID=186801 RepID=UPI000E4E4675|nr:MULTISPECIES: histidine kinase [Clostridia]RHV01682.1 HAMP domain-containing protein [Firmicutes bacterium OM07-11]RKQ24149.1 HAMP domain-containing protein [Ruminococcus sp. B05]TAP30461.1 HAMP domain-containing protein [Mediterraneibacter sp. gm002]
MRKRHSLKKELTVFILMASLVTLLSVAIAVCYVFFSFFFKNTQEDIEYVLNNTTQQYQSHMQFIEDGAIAIRHNSLLESFFQCDEYDSEEAKKQLVYSMELFAERNRVNQQYPFVKSMYLFNNQEKCVKEHYYAITLNSEKEEEIYYQNMQQWFKLEKNRYACVTDRENLNILFRIYDDNMKEKGIGIAQISCDAIREIFKEVEDYQDYSWIVLSNNDLMLLSGGDEKQNELMKETSVAWAGNKEIDGIKVIGSADSSGFGTRTIIAVGQSNILAILQPTLFIFLVGLVIVILFTFCVSYGLSYRFSKPVTRMISNIRAFGKQNLDVRMEDSTIQEFHDIGQVFNEMADRIEYLITEVYEKQLLATKSQVKYLQSQLNPHFQFNILAMLSLKAKMSGNEELYESLNAFSKLMQGKIFRDKEIKIKVKEELEIVQFYLFLQKERYQDKLMYEINLSDEQIKENLIPRLLIEPLVENAVSHGLEPQKERGMIKVCLYEESSSEKSSREEKINNTEQIKRLHIIVEDNGVGMDYEKLNENYEKETLENGEIGHTHTGLKNTQRMLRILYGEDYELDIESKKGKGTKIEIILPSERGTMLCGK